MTAEDTPVTLAGRVASNMPFLRRYARALTGSQEAGDARVAATLEALIDTPDLFDADLGDKVALFRVFHTLWSGQRMSRDSSGDHLEARARDHLAKLTANSREALLLSAIEDFTAREIASILDVSPIKAEELVATAFQEMENAIAGRILVIEDEAVIALELEGLVSDIGHTVVGVARTHAAAVKLGLAEKPDLILADIRLADDSSGIDAVNELMPDLGDVPVIFITAYPERLLTGKRPEPAFLITKPYTETQVRTAVSQAMFFASTETLTA